MGRVIHIFGVAISTLNRRDVFDKAMENWCKYTPSDVPVFIVDDGSDVPVPGAAHRNPFPRGIANAKNHGIRLLMNSGVDHLFVVDDDCWPTEERWWKPYVESGEHHLSYQPTKIDYCSSCRRTTNWVYYNRLGRFTCESHEERREIYRDDKIRAVDWGSGVFLYLTRHAVETAGGMRPEFGRWSCEHWEFAYRLRNLGLCRFPFQDVLSLKLYARDAYTVGRSTCVPIAVRNECRSRNWQLFQKYKDSTDYVPYADEVRT